MAVYACTTLPDRPLSSASSTTCAAPTFYPTNTTTTTVAIPVPLATAPSDLRKTTTTTNRTSLRFSTYSGAPSLHPSIAATMDSTTSHPIDSARNTMTKTPTDADKIARSASSASSADARSQELRDWAASYERMSDQRLEKQRFVPSDKKDDEISTNALGAKLERALGRRMSGQDAVFKRREMTEKSPIIA
ncbi:hypothetical protein CAC42_2671 [Sphaceloma murrayae]|uniref:Uncharacterized protein n=1 Tax=Sphaceloma murrayae TaxID=2082308 RepID=A0A2K1QJM3_9PEZI|nr:hypothetical protein CAC42_2671 [Sphaceloma murrayae]